MSGDLYWVTWDVQAAVPGSEQCFPNIRELWEAYDSDSSIQDDAQASGRTKFPRQGADKTKRGMCHNY